MQLEARHAMTHETIVQTLKAHEQTLRERFGVKSLALFGSMVRGEANETSDVDILVEFDRCVSLFDLSRLEDYLSDVLGGAKVDLVLRAAVIDDLKDIIFAEAVNVVG